MHGKKCFSKPVVRTQCWLRDAAEEFAAVDVPCNFVEDPVHSKPFCDEWHPGPPVIGEMESGKVREECPQTALSLFAGFLLSLMVQKSLLGIPGFGMIADTQLSHVILEDL